MYARLLRRSLIPSIPRHEIWRVLLHLSIPVDGCRSGGQVRVSQSRRSPCCIEAASGGEGQEMRKYVIEFALFVFVFGQLSQRVLSQSSTSVVEGVVQDATGAVIQNSNVTLLNTDNGGKLTELHPLI